MSRTKTASVVLMICVISAPAVANEYICVYKTQDWSLMREFLDEFSKQKRNKEVAKAARLALQGAKTH